MRTKLRWLDQSKNLAFLLISRNKRTPTPVFFRAYEDRGVLYATKKGECKDCCVYEICGGADSGGPKYHGKEGLTYFCCNMFELDRPWITANTIGTIRPVEKNEDKELRKVWKSLAGSYQTNLPS